MVFLRAHAARVQMAEERPYKKETGDYAKAMLVLGDSTGAGVGAHVPEESVPGRLASYIGATHVENYAASGATVTDLKDQIDKATLSRYDTILLMIGGNDILFFHSAKKSAKKLDILMMTLPEASTVILMTAGNIGGATIFPFIVRPFHMLASLSFRKWFKKVAKLRGALYVDLYEPFIRDPFLEEPDRYLSSDGLHPSSEGYGLWFAKVKQSLA
jgi:lysophospholipase L1-like esterase